MDNNSPYRAPRADLTQPQTQSASSIPEEVYLHLSGAGFWARFTAVILFVLFAFGIIVALLLVFGAISKNEPVGAILVLISALISLPIIFMLGLFMSRYASAAKRIKYGQKHEMEVINCFEGITSYNKMLSLLYIIFAVVAIIGVVVVVAAAPHYR